MAEWRLGLGWSESALGERLAGLDTLERNYTGSHDARMAHPDWETHGSRSLIGTGDPGPAGDDPAFERLRAALRTYAFSDPGIVEAHFDPDEPFLGRRMLLELKVPALRYLCGVVVGDVREEREDGSTTFGFRYDTLEGHVERGSEWFLIRKDHATGEVRFEVEATWRPGDFPNWWSRLGFTLVGRHYQRRWHRRAHRRMAAFLRGASIVEPLGRRELAHQGPDVVFTRGARDGPTLLDDAPEDDIQSPPRWEEAV